MNYESQCITIVVICVPLYSQLRGLQMSCSASACLQKKPQALNNYLLATKETQPRKETIIEGSDSAAKRAANNDLTTTLATQFQDLTMVWICYAL